MAGQIGRRDPPPRSAQERRAVAKIIPWLDPSNQTSYGQKLKSEKPATQPHRHHRQNSQSHHGCDGKTSAAFHSRFHRPASLARASTFAWWRNGTATQNLLALTVNWGWHRLSLLRRDSGLGSSSATHLEIPPRIRRRCSSRCGRRVRRLPGRQRPFEARLIYYA
jgi:hypothetical protein